jgi:hypothetical protein
MKPLVSQFLCALALALPLVAVLLLPCEQYQDSQTLLPGNTANSSFPSNSTTSTPSPHLACSLYPHRIWSALESLFVPGTFSRAVSYHAASASTQPPASSGVSVQPAFSPHLVRVGVALRSRHVFPRGFISCGICLDPAPRKQRRVCTASLLTASCRRQPSHATRPRSRGHRCTLVHRQHRHRVALRLRALLRLQNSARHGEAAVDYVVLLFRQRR